METLKLDDQGIESNAESRDRNNRDRHQKVGQEIAKVVGRAESKPGDSDIQSFMRRHGRDLSVFAGDASLNYKTHNTPGINTAYFNPKEVSINIPESWLSNPEYNQPQLKWIQYHELGHFIDMRKNPEVFLDNFKKMEQDAKKLTRDIIARHPKVDKNKLEGYIYEGIHSLYNRLDDIYVNNLVGIRSPNYRNGENAKDVSKLYIDKLGYSETDISEIPPHEQFSVALLQDEMVGDVIGRAHVSDKVEAVLAKKILGRNIREIVDQKLKPTPNRLVDPKDRYNLIRAVIQPEYYKLMMDFIEEKLYEEENMNFNQQDQESDSQGSDSQESQDSQESDSQGSDSQDSQDSQQDQESDSQDSQQDQESDSQDSQESDSQGLDSQDSQDSQESDSQDSQQDQESQDSQQSDQTKNHSHQTEKNRESSSQMDADIKADFLDYYEENKDSEMSIDEETVRQILEFFVEQQKIDAMSPKEREDYLSKKQQEQFDEENNISSRERDIYESVKARIDKPRKEMRNFWKNLIGKSIEYESQRVDQQRRGKLNVNDFIDNYAQITESQKRGDNREMDIYSRNELEAIPVEKPEKIEISLVIDGSRSMVGDKIKVARATAELLMLSIKDFNDYLNQTRHQTKSKLRADTEVLVFGSDFAKVKSFSDGKNVNIEEADIIKSISKINGGYGSTADHNPLNYISATINKDQLHKISQQKLKKIVFHITDGGSNNPQEAQWAVSRLIDEGVLTFAFQIGEVNYRERAKFEYVWNSQPNGLKMGMYIGENIASLPLELSKKLTEALKGIRL